MRLTIFGATGGTGRPLVERALGRGHEVVAFVRDPPELDVEHGRLTVVVGDAYTGENVEKAVAESDAVVSVLGQSSSGPDDLLTVAGERVVSAMERHGVDRYVTLVGAGVRFEGDPGHSLGGKLMNAALKLFARNVLADARSHAAHVRSTDVDWTIVRAPRLTDGEPTGEYRTGSFDPGLSSVPRADVAAFALDCVERGQYVRALPMIAPE